jgi:two-component system, OmpR family, sensor histidine kinase VicK
MQAVNEKWYIAYRWVSLAAGMLLLIFAGALWFTPDVLPWGKDLHIGYFTGVVGLVQVLFGVALYDQVANKKGHWEAMLVLAMIQAVTIFSLVHTTGRMESPFIIWWGIVSLMSGVFGIYGSGGTAFITTIYFVSTTTGVDGKTNYSLQAAITLGALLLVSVISQFFWRRLYTDQDSTRVASLRGQLKATEQQSEILVESLTDGVLLLDTEGVISLMNPAAATMTGWSIEDGTGTDYRSVLSLKNEDGSELLAEDNPFTRIFQTRTATTKILQLFSRDGKVLTVSLVTSPVLNPKNDELSGAVAVFRDISVAHQTDKQRADFVSTASHEMRTPVAAIEGYLQLALNEKVSKIDPKARNYLEKALDSTHHLGQLFQDLLTSAKAEDGRLVSHPSVVELGAYLENLADTFRFAADKKGLLTDFIFGSSGTNTGSQAGEHVVRPLYYVHVDPDRLREVITNLFDNAVKYTPSGKISVGLTGNNDVVQLFVKDTGPGIPPEDVPHLFQKFYRVDNSATRTIGGTGLGLFISKKIIELYKGRIWAESTVGKGSTFYINLPRLSAQRAEELKTAEAQSTSTAPISSLTTPV